MKVRRCHIDEWPCLYAYHEQQKQTPFI
jgi:hypothetical protein